MGSFGEELKREREVRGVTIGEIAEATRIHPNFLDALEADDYASLPPAAYARGFVKAYARFLGMDEERTCNHFMYGAASAPGNTGHAYAQLDALGRGSAHRGLLRGRAGWWSLLGLAALAAGIIYWVLTRASSA